MKKIITKFFVIAAMFNIGCCESEKSPLDYVNPYMGNISHLLVPTYPTVHLPYSMMRLHPQKLDYTSVEIKGLPLFINRHRRQFTFNMSPVQGNINDAKEFVYFTYDHENIRPHYFDIILDEKQTEVQCAVSHQSAIYDINFTQNEDSFLTFNSAHGKMIVDGNVVKGYEIDTREGTRIYIYLEVDKTPSGVGVRVGGEYIVDRTEVIGKNACVVLSYDDKPQRLRVRYGISFISEEQAKANLYREQEGFDLEFVKETGQKVWGKALGSIDVDGVDEDQKSVFYTSLYRSFERPVCLSEDGRYYSVEDQKVHSDGGRSFYTDDWIWDTYLTTHPLRTIIHPKLQQDILNSYISLAFQKPEGRQWMPTFPGPTGDYNSMNCNHAVSLYLDASNKGLNNFNLSQAYDACRGAIEDKTLIPWSNASARDDYDGFYKENGFLPSLHPDEEETMEEVSKWELRQTVAVTLGTSYDHWCLSELAEKLNKSEDQELFAKRGYNYRNLMHPVSKFFHPKDREGEFIPNFDYQFSGGYGRGGRAYYAENNGYVYRWDVKHNIPDLINLMDGCDKFCQRLDSLFITPLGRDPYKVRFYAEFGGDHTGNVGQYSMGNEPGFHIPYLYNYAGQPWKSQKLIRSLVDQWFRSDVMGIPGDEDGGSMSSFVVFSMMGLYPVTPGLPIYSIGSPHFPYVKINLENGHSFEIVAENCSKSNKYIQSATINGRELNVPFIEHADIASGGQVIFIMGSKPNKEWGVDKEAMSELQISIH